MTEGINLVLIDAVGNHICNECAEHSKPLTVHSYAGNYLFCCGICHREYLNGVLSAPTMPEPKAQEPIRHPKSGYTGLSAKHAGLQGHSQGELYPCIIVGYGDGSSGVMLGGLEVRGLTDKTARAIAAEVKDVIDSQGYKLGLIRLHSLSIRSFMNT